MKINKLILNESPEEFKDEYIAAKDINGKANAIVGAINEVTTPGVGEYLKNNLGEDFLNIFMQNFHWGNLDKKNAFIKILNKFFNSGLKDLLGDIDTFTKIYNCYCSKVFDSEDLADATSVVFNKGLWDQTESDIKYILKVDDMLSTKHNVEKYLELENINSKTVAARLAKQGIDYDKVVDMLANEDYRDLRHAILYDDNGDVRSAAVIKRIIDVFKLGRLPNKVNKVSIDDVTKKLNNLDREDIEAIINSVDPEVRNDLIKALRG